MISSLEEPNLRQLFGGIAIVMAGVDRGSALSAGEFINVM